MSANPASNPAEVHPIDRPARKERKLPGKKAREAAPNIRFFLGEAGAEGAVSLKQEFSSEVEAQLESLKLGRPYHLVESWQAVPDLSRGIIAVQKRALGRKT